MSATLIALLKAQSILKDERIKRSDMTALNSSLDCDLDEISDRIHHIVQEMCREFGFSDYDMSLVKYLESRGIILDNMKLLGWEA